MKSISLYQSLRDRPLALVVSVALHVVIFIIVGVSFSSHDVPERNFEKKQTVKAYAVDESQVAVEIEKLKRDEERKKQAARKAEDDVKKKVEQEKRRLEKLKKEQRALEKKKEEQKKAIAVQKAKEEKRRREVEAKAAAEEAKRKADVAAAEKKRIKEQKRIEQERLAEIERKREAEEAELRRLEAQEELKRRMEAEERDRIELNKELASLRDQYVRLIEQKVERNWLRPAGLDPDYRCEIFVTQSVLGDVIDVRLGSCSSDQIFKNSIERAVRKSSPLPPPPRPEVFDREIRFIFVPRS